MKFITRITGVDADTVRRAKNQAESKDIETIFGHPREGRSRDDREVDQMCA